MCVSGHAGDANLVEPTRCRSTEAGAVRGGKGAVVAGANVDRVLDRADFLDHQRIEIRRIGDIVDLALLVGTDPTNRSELVGGIVAVALRNAGHHAVDPHDLAWVGGAVGRHPLRDEAPNSPRGGHRQKRAPPQPRHCLPSPPVAP